MSDPNEPVISQNYGSDGEPRGRGRGGLVDLFIPENIKALLSHIEEVGAEGKQVNLSNGKIIHHGTAFTWIPNPE